jgi:hypothetical protein
MRRGCSVAASAVPMLGTYVTTFSNPLRGPTLRPRTAQRSAIVERPLPRNADIRQIARVGYGGNNRRQTGLIAAIAHGVFSVFEGQADEVPQIARAQPVLGADRFPFLLVRADVAIERERHVTTRPYAQRRGDGGPDVFPDEHVAIRDVENRT